MAEHIVDPYAEKIEPDKEAHSSHRALWFGGIFFVVAALFAGMIIYSIYENEKSTLQPGDEAPDFSLSVYNTDEIGYTDATAVMEMSGETIKLSDFEGDKVVVINFWQDQCPPCHEEADMLVQTYEDYRDQGVVLIGINVKDPDDVAYGFLSRYTVTYPNGLDRRDRIADEYRITGQPETFIIGRDGKIRRHWAGPLRENEFRAEIDRALESS